MLGSDSPRAAAAAHTPATHPSSAPAPSSSVDRKDSLLPTPRRCAALQPASSPPPAAATAAEPDSSATAADRTMSLVPAGPSVPNAAPSAPSASNSAASSPQTPPTQHQTSSQASSRAAMRPRKASDSKQRPYPTSTLKRSSTTTATTTTTPASLPNDITAIQSQCYQQIKHHQEQLHLHDPTAYASNPASAAPLGLVPSGLDFFLSDPNQASLPGVYSFTRHAGSAGSTNNSSSNSSNAGGSANNSSNNSVASGFAASRHHHHMQSPPFATYGAQIIPSRPIPQATSSFTEFGYLGHSPSMSGGWDESLLLHGFESGPLRHDDVRRSAAAAAAATGGVLGYAPGSGGLISPVTNGTFDFVSVYNGQPPKVEKSRHHDENMDPFASAAAAAAATAAAAAASATANSTASPNGGQDMSGDDKMQNVDKIKTQQQHQQQECNLPSPADSIINGSNNNNNNRNITNSNNNSSISDGSGQQQRRNDLVGNNNLSLGLGRSMSVGELGQRKMFSSGTDSAGGMDVSMVGVYNMGMNSMHPVTSSGLMVSSGGIMNTAVQAPINTMDPNRIFAPQFHQQNLMHQQQQQQHLMMQRNDSLQQSKESQQKSQQRTSNGMVSYGGYPQSTFGTSAHMYNNVNTQQQPMAMDMTHGQQQQLHRQSQQHQQQQQQQHGSGGYNRMMHSVKDVYSSSSTTGTLSPMAAFQPPQSRKTNSSSMYGDRKSSSIGMVEGIQRQTYSNVQVLEYHVGDSVVMRREKDGWVNATHILKAAGLDKGRRTKTLEREVHNGEHDKIQGGYGKYQGTYIPLERARALSRQYGLEELISPLLECKLG